MKRKIIFISDFFLDDFVGGAALNDEEAVSLLESDCLLYTSPSPRD